MHEFGIAESILNSALEAAQKNGSAKVELIRIRVGALAGVVEEALTFAFEALSEDTPAQGAKLAVEAVPVTCYCKPCDREFEAPRFSYRCPVCQTLSQEVRRGRELELVSIEVS
jgi:hydrogenase nickel incorporation protein HypA/HybF